MRERWTKLVAIFCITAMIFSQNGSMLVRAEEVSAHDITVSETEEITEEKTIEEVASEEETLEGENAEEKTTEEVASEEETLEGENAEEKTTEEVASEEETVEVTTDEETTEEETTEEYGVGLMAEDTIDEVQPVTNLRWSEDTPGEAVFYNPNDENVSFVLHYYKDGQHVSTWNTSIHGAREVSLPVYSNIYESGEYTYVVETFGYGVEKDWDLSSGCISEKSPIFSYTRPSEQIEAPKNIIWSTEGVLSWDKVEHARSYDSELAYADDSMALGYRQVAGFGWSETYEDYSEEMASGYDYYARVRAVSENINLYANSNFSDWVAFDGSATVGSANGKLDQAFGDGVTTENAQAVANAVKASFEDETAKGELQVAMQTDIKTQEKIKDLEEAYKTSMGLETAVNPSDDIGVDASSVSLLGAALNATENGGSVTFNMSKPDEETQKDLITNSRFSKAIVLDLELEGAGITAGEPLAIPVTVTMPAPEGIDINRLTVLHYNVDNSTYEHLQVRKNSDGTISFTVTHFSNFVFGEKQQTSENTGRGSSNTHVSSGSGSSSTVHVPAWKPTTPDEIKRYSFVGKEKVNFVADVNNAYPVTVVNAMQGKLCFDVFEAVLGDYSIGRTYNIFPNKKTTYKMDSAAKITLSIPKELQGETRDYKMICVTENGQPIILDDMDLNPSTITFETDSYYAFALVYKDGVSVQ